MSYSIDKLCPRCEGPVEYDLACHTYPRTRDDGTVQWMSCLPCDSAYRYSCIAWTEEDELDEWLIKGEDAGMGCGWYWTRGLNPGNPRTEENDANRPEWWDSF